MKLKQISIFIENSPGRLCSVTQLLGEAGINLRALSLVDKGEFGILRLLVSDLAKTRRIIMENHFPAQVDDVVVATITDKPGSLAKVLKLIQDANLNVAYMYAFNGFASDKAVMIFRFSDNDRAIEVLQANGVGLLDAEAFGMIDMENG